MTHASRKQKLIYFDIIHNNMKEIQLSDGRRVTIETEGDKWTFQLQNSSGQNIDTFEDDPSLKINPDQQEIEAGLFSLGFSVTPINIVGDSWLREHVVNEDDLMAVGMVVLSIIFDSIDANHNNDEKPTFFNN